MPVVTPWSSFPHSHCLLLPVVTPWSLSPPWSLFSPCLWSSPWSLLPHGLPMVSIPSVSLVIPWSPLWSPSPHGLPVITVPSMPPSSLSPPGSFQSHCPHHLWSPRGHGAPEEGTPCPLSPWWRLYLTEGDLELPHAHHVRRLLPQLRAHHLHKVLEVHAAAHCGGKGTPSAPQRPPGPLPGSPTPLTPHLDVLGDLDELHLGGHVPQRAHAGAQVLVADVAVLVCVELLEGVQQLWAWPRVGTGTPSGMEAHTDTVSPRGRSLLGCGRPLHGHVPTADPSMRTCPAILLGPVPTLSPPRPPCSPSSSSGDSSRSCMGHTEGVTAE